MVHPILLLRCIRNLRHVNINGVNKFIVSQQNYIKIGDIICITYSPFQ